MTGTMLSLRHISKTFQDGKRVIAAIEDITFEVQTGEFFILLGPSGCGKSTLLRIMSGLEKTYTGTMTISSEITKQDVSFVFQQFALWPWLTVWQNVEIGLIARGIRGENRKRNVVRELTRLGLTKFAHAYPRELSGGMRQRVGIARALATDPKIIFMDEPCSELDSFTAAALRQELLRIWQETKTTIVMVTHLIEEALELGDRIAVLTSRPGKVEHILVNTLPRPRAKRSSEFFTLEDRLYKLVSP